MNPYAMNTMPNFSGYPSPQTAFQNLMNNYQPYAQNSIQSTTGQSQLIRVNGLDGAKAYQMLPNSSAALFDANDDILYIKSTDGAGFGSIRKFRISEEFDNPKPLANNDYVSRAEFQELKNEVEKNAKLSVQSSTANNSNGNSANYKPSQANNGKR